MFIGIQMAFFFPPVVRQILAGDFQGLAVMGVYSIAPIVITTGTDSGVLVVKMIGTNSSS